MTMRYSPPRIVDHGSLVDLTADFDVHFIGSVAKVVSLAAVSPVISGGIPGGDGSPKAGGALDGVSLGGGESGRPSGVLGDAVSGAAPAAGGVAGAAADSLGGTGKGGLPFTGYYATLTAAAGATLAAAGAALRSRLRRKG